MEIIKFGDNTNTFAYDRTIFMAKIRKELEQICEISEDDDKKKRIIAKKDIKRIIKRSPDHADAWVMRFVFDADKYMDNNREFTVGVVQYERDSDYDEIQKMAG